MLLKTAAVRSEPAFAYNITCGAYHDGGSDGNGHCARSGEELEPGIY